MPTWLPATVVASVLYAMSTWVLVRANPKNKLPFWSRAPHDSPVALGFRFAALLVYGFGAMMRVVSDGWAFAVATLLIILAPSAWIQAQHNRFIARRPS